MFHGITPATRTMTSEVCGKEHEVVAPSIATSELERYSSSLRMPMLGVQATLPYNLFRRCFKYLFDPHCYGRFPYIIAK